MNLSVGLVGLPNAGKSTLFNALLKKQLAKVAEYPFTTIEPHEGAIDVPDERLDRLWEMVKGDPSTKLRMTEQVKTPATVTFIDIAGLVKGAHKGEGLGNEFLGKIREVDAILQVVRSFEDERAVHTLGTIDPERDIEIVNMELILKDLEIASRLGEKEKNPEIKNLLARIKEALNSGKMVKDLVFSPEEKSHLQFLPFLTGKPMFYVLNISEKELGSENLKNLEDKDFPALPAGRLVVCAKMESDLIELDFSEQKEYLSSAGVQSCSLEKVIKESFEILDLITFFTIKGGKEVRAWPTKKGTTAYEAAGLVHTDMQKGFIKAEVINYVDFVKIDNWHKGHEMGKIRLEGHDYILQDGDIIEFKFKV
jgi:GTP-binding protein YchF